MRLDDPEYLTLSQWMNSYTIGVRLALLQLFLYALSLTMATLTSATLNFTGQADLPVHPVIIAALTTLLANLGMVSAALIFANIAHTTKTATAEQAEALEAQPKWRRFIKSACGVPAYLLRSRESQEPRRGLLARQERSLGVLASMIDGITHYRDFKRQAAQNAAVGQSTGHPAGELTFDFHP